MQKRLVVPTTAPSILRGFFAYLYCKYIPMTII
nr:MAG TPA: hypothetical protein [Caudoviricetes sp.]